MSNDFASTTVIEEKTAGDETPSKEDGYYPEDTDDLVITSYDISVTPNDFNVLTIFSSLDRGTIVLPEFQRNYVWDVKKASKLIESLIMGLPVPQIFLYQKERNKFLIIDGQQRLLSLYFFIKGKFPRRQKSVEIRKHFSNRDLDDYLNNEDYFTDFKLSLPRNEDSGTHHPLQGETYETLSEGDRSTLEMMTIRCMAIRQTSPEDGDGSIYEIFSRLNTGGVNLSPQEVRGCLYESDFYRMLYRINGKSEWRRIIGKEEPDPRYKDVEMMLRALALYTDHSKYSGAMVKFLNSFSKRAMNFDAQTVQQYEHLLERFLQLAQDLPANSFKKDGRFNLSLFEAVFCAVADTIDFESGQGGVVFTQQLLEELKNDPSFIDLSRHSTSHAANVRDRLSIAASYLQR